MSFSKSTLQILALITIFAGLSGYNFMRAAWVAPTATPPTGNVDAPINIGSSNQIKAGGLSVNALSINGNQLIESLNPLIIFRDEDAVDFRLLANGNIFSLQTDRDGDGAWDTPNPFYVSASTTLASNYATFANQVRATEYCDRRGDNCFQTDEMPSGKKCPSGKYLRGFAVDGSVLCATMPEAGSSCTEESMFAQACQLNPTCPSGWTPAGPITKGAGCEQGAKYNVQQCTKLICDGQTSGCNLGSTEVVNACSQSDGSEACKLGWVPIKIQDKGVCTGGNTSYAVTCAKVACI